MTTFNAHVWTTAAILATTFVMFAYARYQVSALLSMGKRAHMAAESAMGMIIVLVFKTLLGYALVRGFSDDGGTISHESLVGIVLFMIFITSIGLSESLSAKVERDPPKTDVTISVSHGDPDAAAPGDHEGTAAVKRVRSGPRGLEVDLVVDDAKVVLKGRLADDFLRQMAAGDWAEDRHCSFTVGEDDEVTSFRVEFE